MCRDRIYAWKKTILDAVARCWVYESENPKRKSALPTNHRRNGLSSLRAANTAMIRLGLLEVTSSLSSACPSIIEVRRAIGLHNEIHPEVISQHDIPRLKSAYPALGDIFPQVIKVTNQGLDDGTEDEYSARSESI